MPKLLRMSTLGTQSLTGMGKRCTLRQRRVMSPSARAGMNPKTLQYLMGHSDIGVTLNVYTHLGLEDAAAEMARMEAVETARKEQEKISGKRERENTVTQKMFRAF